MIRELELKDVGPTRALIFDLSERLNVITGNNGLGKTFVLDTLWWVVTGAWAGWPAFPWRPPARVDARRDADAAATLDPRISATLIDREAGRSTSITGTFHRKEQRWTRSVDRPETTASVIIYARVDGRFAVWDSLYAHGSPEMAPGAALSLSEAEVWDGKVISESDDRRGERQRTVIRGLIDDWVAWQRSASPEFTLLRRVLTELGTDDEPLTPGEPTRVLIDDRRDIPTLDAAHGVVPVTLASAGIRRALALAYLLVWSWSEHGKAAELLQAAPARDIVLLIDEPELHLHPAWQQVFVPSVMRAVNLIARDAAVQIVAATHSPLVMASLESSFRESVDDLFILEADGSLIRAVERPFSKMGDVVYWLDSEVFGRVGGRSIEGSLAVKAAQHFMAEREAEADRALSALMARSEALDERVAALGPAAGLSLAERIHRALAMTLPGHDEFWVHWSLVYHPSHGTRPAR